MRLAIKGALIGGAVVVATAILGLVMFIRMTGLSAQPEPGSVEAAVARALRGWAIPDAYRARENPVAAGDESVRTGLEHYADHCAVCHGNDGSGETDFGRGLFPRPPDMRLTDTQQLTDGELFYVIEHGVRFTGMPAFGTGTAEGEEESWHLVNFLRRLAVADSRTAGGNG
jgi:mono/diheme cytochrome c family protein